MNSERSFSFEEIQIKLESYCAYQERCSHEILEKAKSFGLSFEDSKTILQNLIKKKFVDDERFAQSYAIGKFRFKNWGRIKIKFELKLKRLPDSIITKAIYGIDEDEYLETIKDLVTRKRKEVKGKSDYEKKAKVFRFLQSKGFESDLISKFINSNSDD